MNQIIKLHDTPHQLSPHQQHHLYIYTISTITPPHQQHTAFYHLHITDHHLQSEGHLIENSCPAHIKLVLMQLQAVAVLSAHSHKVCKFNKMARTFYCSFVPFLDLFFSTFYFWVCSFVPSISGCVLLYLLFLGVFFCTFYFWVCSFVPFISGCVLLYLLFLNCLFICTSYIYIYMRACCMYFICIILSIK